MLIKNEGFRGDVDVSDKKINLDSNGLVWIMWSSKWVSQKWIQWSEVDPREYGFISQMEMDSY